MPKIHYWVIIILGIFLLSTYSTAFADPVIEWNTFAGSAVITPGYYQDAQDYGQSATIDSDGNIYVAGESMQTWGSPIRLYGGVGDVVVVKYDTSGNMLWNTFLGTHVSNDYKASIAADNNGNIYVTGTSNASWGSPINPHPGSGADVFISKLNSNGALIWNTFLGGWTAYSAALQGIGIDGDGNVYVTGYSRDWGSPIIPITGTMNIFVAKLDSSGTLLWNSFLGGFQSENSFTLNVDQAGNVYVANRSQENWGSPIEPYTADQRTLIVKLDTNGALQWNTFVKPSVYSLDVDSEGNVYGGGSGVDWGNPINPCSECLECEVPFDMSLIKLNSEGIYQWHTYMGSDGYVSEFISSVKIDENGSIYVAGECEATWGSPAYPHNEQGDYRDGFVAKLDTDGNYQWHAFFGGLYYDEISSVLVDNDWNVFIAGSSIQPWGTPINAHAEMHDIFLVKFHDTDGDDTVPPSITSTTPLDSVIDVPINTTLSATFSEDMDPSTIDTNTFSVDNGVTGTISYDIGTKTATFTPTANLTYSTTYTATVTTGVKDLALNPLQTDHTWSFTTVPAPDTTPPVVDSTSPDDNETDVPVDSVISVTFSENMDAATIDSNTLHLDNGATCSVSYDAGTRTATLTPLADLNEDTTYTVTVTTGVQDVAGNALQADSTCSFTTISATVGNGDSGGSGGSGGCFINTMLK
jgi:hypothetical protein